MTPRKRLIWVGPVLGAIGMVAFNLYFFATHYSLAYVFQAAFVIVLFQIPIGMLIGLAPGVVWWLVLRYQARHIDRLQWVAALSGGMVFGVLAGLAWAALDYPGAPLLVGAGTFIVSSTVFRCRDVRLPRRRSRIS